MRLVRVLRTIGTVIRCTIRTVELESARYKCLSYQWGDPEEQDTMKRIIINGQWFKIRRNLWDFLKRARRRYANTEFWIDAICIDQTNVSERNKQVSMMEEIYREATVITWLGEPGGQLSLSTVPDNQRGDIDQFFRAASPKKSLKRQICVVISIGYNPYWQRAWVVQEQRLAGNVTLLVGSSTYTLEQLQSTRLSCLERVSTFYTPDPRVLAVHATCKSALEFVHMRPFLEDYSNPLEYDSSLDLSSMRKSRSPGQARQPLPIVLREHSYLASSDIHDRIYSLRSLILEGDKIAVDYNLSIEALIIQTLSAPKELYCFCFILDVFKALDTINSYCTEDLALPDTYDVVTTQSCWNAHIKRWMRWCGENFPLCVQMAIDLESKHGRSVLKMQQAEGSKKTDSTNHSFVHDISAVCPNLGDWHECLGFRSDGRGKVNVLHSYGASDCRITTTIGVVCEVEFSSEPLQPARVVMSCSLPHLCAMAYMHPGRHNKPCDRQIASIVRKSGPTLPMPTWFQYLTLNQEDLYERLRWHSEKLLDGPQQMSKRMLGY